jgi:YD repeat-containing protein
MIQITTNKIPAERKTPRSASLIRKSVRSLSLIFIAAGSSPTLAQDAKTYGQSFAIPMLEQIDQNGVDLLSGRLRIVSPMIESGSERKRNRVGFVWAGKAWQYLDQPTVFRDGSKYIVTYNGQSEEFGDRGSGYAQRKPITGSKFSCSIYEPGNLASECIYIDRMGDIVHFWGLYSNLTQTTSAYGPSSVRYGNLGMQSVEVRSGDDGYNLWGQRAINTFTVESDYNKPQIIRPLGDQKLTLSTSNFSGSGLNDHYLLPKGTTQTITDDVGAQWSYSFDSAGKMTYFTQPGGANAVSILYTGDRVSSINNADGKWTYDYVDIGSNSVTTVTSPLGEKSIYSYQRDKRQLFEFSDNLGRTTKFFWNADERLSKVTYPEQNIVELVYDARGNVLTKTVTPKPGGGDPITLTAVFDTVCANRKICNRPRYTIDANGAQTDYEYGAVSTGTEFGWNANNNLTVDVGEGKPIKIIAPASAAGIRQEQRIEYTGGVEVKVSTCQSSQSCNGTPDEVVTSYDYGGTESTSRLLFGTTVSSAGNSFRTCYGYDSNRRRVSETPPRATGSSCPTAGVVAVAANAVLPVSGYAVSTPVYPDGSTGGSPPSPPQDPPCGGNTGVVCP